MKRFVRIDAGIVVETMTTHADPSEIFHPSLTWREAESTVEAGWIATEAGFEPPPPPVEVRRPEPDMSQLQAELNALIAKFAAFKAG